jgi:glycosyltransferase involved in cell wall biosynthesis
VRILALTNSLPPENYGYGVICRDVMTELVRRGHTVEVHAAEGGERDVPYAQQIDLAMVPGGWRRPGPGHAAERRNSRSIAGALDALRPDAVLVWHMRGVGKGPLSRAHALDIPVLYMLGDLWVAYEKPGPPSWWRMWQQAESRPGFRRIRDAARRAIGLAPYPPIAREGTVCFTSDWLRRRYAEVGFEPADGHVVPNGIRAEALWAGHHPTEAPLRVAFVGRLDETKGADTAVEAMALGPAGSTLRMAGAGSLETRLRGMVAERGLGGRVEFLGRQSRDAVIRLLQTSDVLIMPGRIDEAFGLVYLEAMATGAAVIGSATGGAAEICRDGENALVVRPGDAAALAGALNEITDVGLRRRLVDAGRRTTERYSLRAMVDRVEALSSRTIRAKSSS